MYVQVSDYMYLQVLVACVTTKYSLSANCRREVSLADAIKTPIIPILLEHIKWPPEGPMGLVLTQLIYINFTRPDETIQNHWSCKQFNELLDKIEDAVPNLDTVGNHNHDDISINKRTTKGNVPDDVPVGDAVVHHGSTGKHTSAPTPNKTKTGDIGNSNSKHVSDADDNNAKNSSDMLPMTSHVSNENKTENRMGLSRGENKIGSSKGGAKTISEGRQEDTSSTVIETGRGATESDSTGKADHVAPPKSGCCEIQ